MDESWLDEDWDELAEAIELEKVSVPTSGEVGSVAKAYLQRAQGFFVKPPNLNKFKEIIQRVVEYWDLCESPI